MKVDFFILLAIGAVVGGVFMYLSRNNGGNGGQPKPTVTPSSRWPGGGWQPGFVSTQVRNGGNGAASPNVMFN